MKANYHTHTPRCRHAVGREEEYIEKAISEGLEVLGFSDHTPQFYGDFVSPIRMLPEEAEEYFETAKRLKREYEGKIKLYFGFETEYHPAIWDKLLALYRSLPVDYLILGQHHFCERDESDKTSVFAPSADPERFKKYMANITEAVRSGLFSAVAHPDVYFFVGDEALYREECEKFIRECIRLDLPLEINLGGVRTADLFPTPEYWFAAAKYYADEIGDATLDLTEPLHAMRGLALAREREAAGKDIPEELRSARAGRHYPSPIFWEIAGRLGAKAVIGCDAHRPGEVADPENLTRGEAFAAKYGVSLIDKITLKEPK